jgi:hypothetical protein
MLTVLTWYLTGSQVVGDAGGESVAIFDTSWLAK